MGPVRDSRSSRVAAAGALALGCLVFTGCGKLSSDELDRGIETVESIAVEGRLLAGQTAEDRIKTTFVRVRARELAEDADHEAEKLADATPSEGLAVRRDSAVALIDEISGALGTLEVFPEDETKAHEAETELRSAGAKVSKLLDHK